MQQPAHPSVESILEEPYCGRRHGVDGATTPHPEARRYLHPGRQPRRHGRHPDGSDGLFHTDTGFLSLFALTMEGVQPLLLGSNVYDDNSMLTVDMTNPTSGAAAISLCEGHGASGAHPLPLARHRASAARGRQLRRPADRDSPDLRVRQRFRRPVRGARHAAHAARRDGAQRHRAGARAALLSRPRRQAAADRAVLRSGAERAAGEVGIVSVQAGAGEVRRLYQFASCDDESMPAPRPFLRGLRSARRDLRQATRNATTVETGNDIFNEVLCRSMSDLCMLITDTPRGLTLRGIPWYSTTFGRDGLITAMQMLAFRPQFARGVLRRLAAFQAKEDDPVNDAQPGKILHEMRQRRDGVLREVPFGLYYGSVDSTPLFVMLAGLYAERTGDDATIVRAVAGDRGGARLDRRSRRRGRRRLHRIYSARREGPRQPGLEGFLRRDLPCRRAAGRGADRARRGAGLRLRREAPRGALRARMGREETARALDSDAARLADAFEAAFWCPELGTYALALDGAKRPCRVRSSNAGQVLFTGICAPERAAEIAHDLMRPHFFSGWGIRTIAQGEARYNPMSYHNGSIWPHDNALIALGLARYGQKRAVERIFQGLFDTASYMDLRRLPELFCGFTRRRGRGRRSIRWPARRRPGRARRRSR